MHALDRSVALLFSSFSFFSSSSQLHWVADGLRTVQQVSRLYNSQRCSAQTNEVLKYGEALRLNSRSCGYNVERTEFDENTSI